MQASRAAHLFRYLRSKIILSIILFLSAMYSLYSFSMKNTSEITTRPKVDVVKWFQDDKLFMWNPNSSESSVATFAVSCRNSLQGKLLIADDLGKYPILSKFYPFIAGFSTETMIDDCEFVFCHGGGFSQCSIFTNGHICVRSDVLPNGCCDTNISFTKRYVCDSCLSNNCCEIYEHCLSCCMNPDKRPLIENVLRKISSRFQFILLETRDQFELCSVKCRTNSKSVYHGNMYRNPSHKYCFGEPPENDDANLS